MWKIYWNADRICNSNPDTEGIKTIKMLLQTQENLLPILLINKGVYVKFNNNRSEAYFG